MRIRTSTAGPRAERLRGVAHLQPRSSGAPHRDSRHSRKCNVCCHPDRDAIEQAFLRWRSPDQIALDYGIADHSSVYRHVHATGLFARRRATLRLALEPLIEQACEVRVTAGAIVSAVRLYAQINDAGEWVGPQQPAPPAESSASSTPASYGDSSSAALQRGTCAESLERPEASLPLSNRQTVRIDHGPTS
jgi:hypothetical protein